MKYVKENYERFYGKVEDKSSYGNPVKVVEKIPALLKSGTVLDLGAGDGRHAIFLAAKGFRVKAVDISEAALSKLKRLADELHVKVDMERADLSHWSIEQDYDVITSTLIFQHLPREQALRILHEMKEHTKPGGVNALVLFTKTGDRYLMDLEEDPEAFYPDDGWLKAFYSDWEILEYEESSGVLCGCRTKADGTPLASVTARILARKPGNS